MMTNELTNNTDIQNLIMLARAALNKKVPSISDHLDLERLYKLAVFHQIAGIIDVALEAAGIKNTLFLQERGNAIRKNLIMDSEREKILKQFEFAGIWYMPLKGVVLQEYYPESGMRQMSDNDILFDATRAEDVKMIMESLGYTTVHFGVGHQDDYRKQPVCHFEMHRTLFSSSSDLAEERLFQYYCSVGDRLVSVGGQERRFTNEDFYLYMVAHEFKHFFWNGTGLKSLLDIYVFLHKFQNDLSWDYIFREIEKMGIAEFEVKNRELAMNLFGTEKRILSRKQQEWLTPYLNAGAYGTKEQGIQKSIQKNGIIKYMIRRVFLSMPKIKASYPFFYEHKILIPFLPIYRLFIRRKNAIREIGMIIGKKKSV